MISKTSKDWHNSQKQALEKRQRLVARLLADYDIKLVAGSFHAWLLLPEPWRALEFQAVLEDRGVKVLPADVFAIGRFHAPQAVRICLSGPPTIQVLETALSIIKLQLEEGYDSRLSVF